MCRVDMCSRKNSNCGTSNVAFTSPSFHTNPMWAIAFESGYGSGCRSTLSTTLKMAVLAPIPSANVAITTPLNVAFFRSDLMANRTSCRNRSGQPRTFHRAECPSLIRRCHTHVSPQSGLPPASGHAFENRPPATQNGTGLLFPVPALPATPQ